MNLECEVTSFRDDGAVRWRRYGASEPSGWIPRDMVPSNVSTGSLVIIEFANHNGRTSPVSCRLRDPVVDATLNALEQESSSNSSAPEPASGLLFRVNTFNLLENENAEGKIRPAVLVSRSGDGWRVMGLTTKSTYQSGEHRRAIPNPSAVGLPGPGFIWGGRLTRVTADSIHEFIGIANYQLVEEIIDIAHDDMSNNEIDDLRSITRVSPHVVNSLDKQTDKQAELTLTSESLLSYFTERSQQVTADLENYFHSGNYTGRHFEYFSRISNPHFFDGNDIAAVMCLSISPKANIPSDLLILAQQEEFMISPGEREKAIWTRSISEYVEGSWFHQLFDELVKIDNVASVVASKLMASKFPHSIPIYVGDVSALLNHPQQWWLGWHETMQSSHLRKRLVSLRELTGLQEVSLLRVADAALWMEAQRRKKDGRL